MKPGIHPEYKEITVTCTCGENVALAPTASEAMVQVIVLPLFFLPFFVPAAVLIGFGWPRNSSATREP